MPEILEMISIALRLFALRVLRRRRNQSFHLNIEYLLNKKIDMSTSSLHRLPVVTNMTFLYEIYYPRFIDDADVSSGCFPFLENNLW